MTQKGLASSLLAAVIVFMAGCSDIFLGHQSSDADHEVTKAKVDHVIDGDTLSVMYRGKKERVRLLLVDTPESVKLHTSVQPYARKASRYVKERIKPGDRIKLEIGKPRRGKYHRLLAYVFVNGQNLNQQLLGKGLARIAYVEPPNTKYLDHFKEVENKAQSHSRNIWQYHGYVQRDGFHPGAIKNRVKEGRGDH